MHPHIGEIAPKVTGEQTEPESSHNHQLHNYLEAILSKSLVF